MRQRKKKRISFTAKLLAAAMILLIAANLLLGIILMNQSKNSMQSLIRSRMLDISNSAAKMLDGDKLEKLTKDDAGTPDYEEALGILRSFQDSIGIEYIYGIHDDGNDNFSFTIDPEQDSPGEFGEPIEYTEALKAASLGTASVDKEPCEDRWGRFYSAYSPVFNSKGEVAGIVGVDFSASWYESRIKNQAITVLIICLASTGVGILMAFTVSARIRKSFTELYNEMNSLASDFENLNEFIQTDSGNMFGHDTEKDDFDTSHDDTDSDNISALGKQIRSLQTELRQYITYMHSQAYTDSMTGVGSKTAYLNKVNSIEELISEKNAAFSVAVFDINGLKTVNDNYGHEMGDKFINGAASAIMAAFGRSSVYRIGGDEFIAVLDGYTLGETELLFDKLDASLEDINRKNDYPITLSVSRGADVFSPETDTDFRQVFKRADESMYRCKSKHYEQLKDSLS